MPLRTECPAGHKLIVPEDRAGRTLRCPRCSASFVVPGEKVQGSRFALQEAAVENREAGRPSPVGPAVAAVVEMPVARAVESPPVRERQELRTVKPKSRPRPPPLPVAQVEVPLEMEAVTPPEAARPQIALAPPAPLPVANEPAPPPAVVAEPTVQPVETAAAILPPTQALAIAPPAVPPPPAAEAVALEASEHYEPEPLSVEPPAAAPEAITPDRHWLPAAYGLSAALVAAALFGIAPAVWDVVDYVRSYDLVDSPHVARWALVVFWLSIVQIAYAAYLFQLPDWTSVWVVTLDALGQAGLYALMLGLVLISGDDGLLVGPRGLELSDKLAGGQAALWCLAMTCVWMILAFFAGRLSGQWRRAETLLRGVGAAPAVPARPSFEI
jgi:hypothetical protein